MFMKTLTTTVLALTMATTAFADNYKIDVDGAHASINFETKHIGISILNGRFDKFDGNFEFDAADPSTGTVSVNIDMQSVNSNHGKRDNHLRSADFFDVSNFPNATFVSTGIELTDGKTGVITGDLTIRGVTKSVAINAEFLAEGDDPWGGYRAGFSGRTTISLGDYGMGGVIGNANIDIILHVEGIRQ